MFAFINSLPPDELYQKAIIFKESEDYDNYIIHMTMAANLGHGLAIEYLYNDYRWGKTHEKQDYSKTVNFYEASIKYSFSANYLGWMFDNGKCLLQDHNKANELYQMAISKSNSAAMINLARNYQRGRGVSKDYNKTIELYEMAIEKGNSTAMYNLAFMYKIGKGVPQDHNKTIELYQMATKKGNSAAMNDLARYYLRGKGVDQDYDKATKLYEMAIEKGNSIAMYNLACMYSSGEGVSKDYNKAVKLYEMAANKGYSSAMYNLACRYKSGKGISKDYEKAVKLFQMAADKGHLKSIESLKRHYRHNPNDLSIIELYDNKHFHDVAKGIISTMFKKNLCLPEQYKQPFANLRFDADIHETVKMKQNILKKTNMWPSNYDSKYLLEFMELLLISSSNNKCLTKDVILYIAGCLFV